MRDNRSDMGRSGFFKPAVSIGSGSSGYAPGAGSSARRVPARLFAALAFVAAAFMLLATYAHAAPPNDNFADAQLLTGLPASGTGSNVDATTEVGEPDHNNNAEEGHSVWYRWVAPVAGPVVVDLGGSNYDTYLAIYTDPNPVPSLATLNLVGKDDDGGAGVASRVSFSAAPGETYLIAVDGFADRTGSIELAIVVPGSISGTVTDEVASPAEDVCVWAYDSSSDRSGPAFTDASGAYSVEGLIPGQYRVEFEACSGGSLLGEYYDDQPTLQSADPVTVVAAADTPGIDAELAEGGTITGTVTDTLGDPVEDVCVGADSESARENRFGRTDTNGDYAVRGLRTADDWVVRFEDCGSGDLLAEYYDDEMFYDDADPVAVTQGVETSGIDAELATGGTMTGTVVNEQAEPLESICVDARSDQLQSANTQTDANGEYELRGLYTARYRIQFYDCGDNNVIGEYYNDAYDRRRADLVAATAGLNVPDINVEMLSPDSPPPDTVIDSGPTGTIRSRKATFTFHGTPEAKTRKIKCRIDQGTYSDCRSAKTFTGLSDGTHTVEFRAVGYAGNSDPTPASRTFTVKYDPCDAARSDLDEAKKKQKKARKQKNKAERSLKKAKKTGKSSKVNKARKKLKKAKKRLNKANRQVESGRKSVDAKC